MRNIACALTSILLVLVSMAPVSALEVEASQLKLAMHSAEKGRSALRTGNVKKALQHFRRSLEIVPNLPEGHLGVGHVFMQKRSFEDALAAFDQARSDYRLMGDALLSIKHLRHENALQEAGRLRGEARKMRQIGLNQPGPGASRYIAAAERLDQQAQRLEAIRPPGADDLVTVPGEVFFHMGNALLNLGRLEEAVEAWETCAQREPAFPAVHHNLAVAYWKLDRLDTAMRSMKQAEALGFPVNPQFKDDLRRGLAAIRPNLTTQ